MPDGAPRGVPKPRTEPPEPGAPTPNRRDIGPYARLAPHDEVVLTQVHCHTTQSDGSYTPEEVVALYAGAGYGALVISDHDTATAPPEGIDTRITGVEHSPSAHHIIGMDSDYVRDGVTNAQTIVDAIVADGGQAEVAHPNWSSGMTVQELSALQHYLGIEIFNQHVNQGTLGAQNPHTTRPGFAVAQWDELLGYRPDRWGFAVDDLHSFSGGKTYDVGRLHVFVGENTKAEVMAALVGGHFVADVSNHGVTPGWPQRNVANLRLTCAGATRMEAHGPAGLLTAAEGDSIDHEWGEEPWVRLVAVGDHAEDFGAALSHFWSALEGSWSVGSGVLSLDSPSTVRRMILNKHRQGAFSAEVKVRLGGSEDTAGLMCNVRGDGNYYYVLEATTAGITLYKVQGGNTDTVGSIEVALATDTWHTLTLACDAGEWDFGVGESADSASDATWGDGSFGFRGRGTPAFDDLYIDGFRSYYQPIPVF